MAKTICKRCGKHIRLHGTSDWYAVGEKGTDAFNCINKNAHQP